MRHLYLSPLILSLLVTLSLFQTPVEEKNNRSRPGDAPVIGGRNAAEWAKLLREGKSVERIRASLALGLLGTDALGELKTMIGALDDPLEDVRFNSRQAIQALGDEAAAAIPSLMVHLGDSEFGEVECQINISAGETLAGIGRPAVQALTKALKSDRGNIRREAAHALWLIGAKADLALESLVPYIDDDDLEVREYVIQTIAAIGPSAQPALPDLLRALDKEPFPEDQASDTCFGYLVDAIARIGGDMPARLKKIFDEDDVDRALSALKLLEHFGDKATIPDRILDKLLGNDDPDIRQTAYLDIARIEKMRPKLIERLNRGMNDRQSSVRSHYAWVLHLIDERVAKSCLPVLIKALEDPDPSVRRFSACAISRIDLAQIRAITVLIDSFKECRNDYCSVIIARSLGNFGTAARASIPAMENCLNNMNDDTFNDIAEALVRIDPTGTMIVPVLTRSLSKRKIDVRKSALASLKTLGPVAKGAVPDIMKILNQRDEDLTSDAIETLGEIGPEARASVPALVEIVSMKRRDAPEPYFAADAIGRIKFASQDAIKALKEFLASEGAHPSSSIVVALINIDPAFRDQAQVLADRSDDFYFRARVLGALGRRSAEADAFMRIALLSEKSSIRITEKTPWPDVSESSQIEYFRMFGVGAELARPRIKELASNKDPHISRLANEMLSLWK